MGRPGTIPTRFARPLSDKTKAVFIESIANPGGVVTDIEAIAKNRERREGSPHRRQYASYALSDPPRRIRRGHHRGISATKYLCGHGNSMGGIIVDCGSFEWMGDNRYPMLSAPRPEYNGMILAETSAISPSPIACRVLSLRRSRPGDLAVQFVPDPERSRVRVSVAHAAPQRQRPDGSRGI